MLCPISHYTTPWEKPFVSHNKVIIIFQTCPSNFCATSEGLMLEYETHDDQSGHL